MAYEIDFRKRVLEYVNTHSIQKAAEIFDVSARAITSWRKLLKETESLKDAPRKKKSGKLDSKKLEEYIKAHPDSYLREMANEFGVVIETIRKALLKMGYTLKKRPNYTKNGMSRGERSISKKYRNIKKKI